jgi:hypothetical protein
MQQNADGGGAMSAQGRTRFREVLSGLASKTQTKLPQLNGRVEKACKLVLGGDVTLRDDGTALVASLTQPSVTYQVAPGLCQCKDFAHAPDHLCCHRLAAGFARKIAEVMASETPPAQALEAPRGPLGEAPSSVNLKVVLYGHECQITLRDDQEDRLLQRLEALLTHKDIRPIPKPAPRAAGQQWKQRRQYQGA